MAAAIPITLGRTCIPRSCVAPLSETPPSLKRPGCKNPVGATTQDRLSALFALGAQEGPKDDRTHDSGNLAVPIQPAAPTPRPTQIGIMLQDPGVAEAHVDVVTLDLAAEGNRPASKDFELVFPLEPGPQGNYVYDLSHRESLLPASVLGNLQRSFDIFTSYCDQVPPTWANGQQRLPIYPDYGVGLEAHYAGGGMNESEAGLYFFHQGEAYTGMSGEIVCHEGGHAILDRFRPKYRRQGGLEAEAFGESFGDVLSMLVNLKDPKIADQVARQTGGDLSRHNVVSDFGEQFGQALKPDGPPWLRSAINSYRWEDPEGLPPQPTQPDQLSKEIHSFSQIWTGAVYDMMGAMVAEKIQAGAAPAAALADAAEDMLKIYGKMISRTAPLGDFRYEDMAQSMVQADQLLGGRWGERIEKTFQDRHILPAPAESRTS